MYQPCTALTCLYIHPLGGGRLWLITPPSWHGEGLPICMALSQIPQTWENLQSIEELAVFAKWGRNYTIPSCLYGVFQAKSCLIMFVTDTTIPWNNSSSKAKFVHSFMGCMSRFLLDLSLQILHKELSLKVCSFSKCFSPSIVTVTAYTLTVSCILSWRCQNWIYSFSSVSKASTKKCWQKNTSYE